ncbi:MFS transporter [Paractinoplanes brasiliensis]|uniref:CP family cyanate transporter-like MFS transporter n=1 Tax=Paractinoplanes brasiliensis TaxID=52695 RepID=A0A4R6JB88_9ACTN|nr:MFS transporter [Actinoplanes brasiliensis]TDO33013.1 CP family cyanate transporter-like MFS transporter [Actinoplanes brasiliensis]GID28730.1 MFS transporter [Actinoplanes brasiliensis]
MTTTELRPARLHVGILLAVALTALNLRTAVTGFSVLTGDAAADLRFGPVTAGAIGTIVTACFAVAAFAAPPLARRLGLERTAALAVTATTAGILLRSAAWSPAVMIAATVIAFAGIGACNVVLIPIVKQHFPERLHTVSTMYMVLLQVGQLAAPLVALPLAHAYGWRAAAGGWAAVTAVAAALWFVAVPRSTGPTPAPFTGHGEQPVATPSAGRGEQPVAAPPTAPGEQPVPVPSDGRGEPLLPAPSHVPWRTPLALGLIGLMAMTTLHVYTLVTWFPAMLEDAGLSTTASALLLSWFAGLGLIAAFVVPPLTTRLRTPYPIVVVCVALMAAGYAGMLAAPAAGAFVWATAFGLGVSTFPLCLTLIGARAANAQSASRLSGVVQGVGYGIGCVGPLALGAIHQATGGWNLTYGLLAATLVVTLVAGWAACRPVRLHRAH